jgi:Protein of unknown function (DUF3035)
MKRTIILASALTAFMVTASGCSALHQAMGFEKQPPDEYTVVENAPLTLPPDFGLLAPSAEHGKPAQSSTEDRAREVVFTAGNTASSGDSNVSGGDLSPGEAALLKGAGAVSPNPAIRQQIDQETAAKRNDSETLINRILYHGLKKKTDETLDAQKESERIQKDVDSGKPITGGDTPAIQRTSHSVLDAL